MTTLAPRVRLHEGSAFPTVKVGRIARIASGSDSRSEGSGHPLYGANGIIGLSAVASHCRPKVLVGRVGSAGAIHYVHGRYGVSDNALVVDPLDGVDAKYLYYGLLTLDLSEHVSTTAQPLLTGTAVRQQYVPLPPAEDQSRIAAYLDYETARIDELTAHFDQLQRFARERHERFVEATLSGATTPAAVRHSPCAPWLDQVPIEWKLIPLRYLADISTGSRDTQDRRDDGGYPFYVRSMNVERIDTYSYDTEAVLTSGDGAGVGEVFHHVRGRFELHQRMYALTGFRNVLGRYLYYFLRAFFKQQMTQWSAKSTVDSVRLPFLKSMRVAIPPPERQAEVVALLDNAESAIGVLDDAINTIQALLAERRSALITSAITGQIDLSSWRPPDDWLVPEPA